MVPNTCNACCSNIKIGDHFKVILSYLSSSRPASLGYMSQNKNNDSIALGTVKGKEYMNL